MAKIIGLDLGTNSAGWSLVDTEQKQIIDAGARIFPEGVNKDNGREVSKNEARRMARQKRRLYFRKALRKEKLVDILMPLGMFPATDHFRVEVQKFVQDKKFKDFFKLDPYQLRRKAAKGEKISLLELGRIFYQFSQRRGYRENLQAPLDEKSNLNTGDLESGKIGIDETTKGIGTGTLGQYLASLNPHEQRIRNRYTTRKMYLDEFEVIWEKQKAYYPEILTDDLKIKLGEPNKGVIFFQRPLRSQSFLKGKCSLEPEYDRIADSAPMFELYRMFAFINNLRIFGKELTTEQRAKILDLFIISGNPKKAESIRKILIGKDSTVGLNYEDEVKLPSCKTIALICDAKGKEYKKNFIAKLASFDEGQIFNEMHAIEEIWKIKKEARDIDWLIVRLTSVYKIGEENALKLVKARFSNNYGSLSRKAIAKILPYMIKGYSLSDSVILGGVRNVYGKQWYSLSDDKKSLIEDNSLSVAYTDKFELALDKVRAVLIAMDAPKNRMKKLYHASDQRQRGNSISLEELDQYINKIKNPIVRAVLFETKSLINEIIKKHGDVDAIKIEMARELKKGKKEREKDRIQNFKNERENDECRAALMELGIPPTGPNILKMKLWRECKNTDPYTGEIIGVNELFNKNLYQVEHIIPYSVSLDDSFANKTLCRIEKNQEKGNKTPYEAFGNSGIWQAMADRAFNLLPYPKAKRFVSEQRYDLDDFISRQLNDVRYITRECASILNAFAPTTITQGGVTSIIRKSWGLNGILNKRYLLLDNYKPGRYCAAIDQYDNIDENTMTPWVKDPKHRKAIEEGNAKIGVAVWGNVNKQFFYPDKTRIDHRHHAVDAIAVALSSATILQKVSTLSAQGVEVHDIDIEMPWDNFYSQAEAKIAQILVSHKNRKRIISNWRKKLFDKNTGKVIVKNGQNWYGQGLAARDQLHNDTNYGLYTDKSGEEHLHFRVPLESRKTLKQIEDIVDPAVKKAVLRHLHNLGLDYTAPKFEVPKSTIEKPVYFSADEHGKKTPLVFLDGKAGRIPIKKVRIRRASQNKIQLHGINRYVEPGNNHHALVFKDHNDEIISNAVSFWEAVERRKQGERIIKLPENGKEILAVLMTNKLFLLGLNGAVDWNNQALLSQHLYRVQKVSNWDFSFRKHEASTLSFNVQLVRIASVKAWLRYTPIEVKVDRLGKITPI